MNKDKKPNSTDQKVQRAIASMRDFRKELQRRIDQEKLKKLNENS